MDALALRSFVAWVSHGIGDPGEIRDATGAVLLRRQAGALTFAFKPRSADAINGNGQDFFLGDGAEIEARDFLRHTASGVPIRVDAAAGRLQLATSIVGMPPVFLYERGGVVALASDIHLLQHVPGVSLEFDDVSVVELGQIGHPIEHRTLFRDLRLIESGALVTLAAAAQRVTIESNWQLPAPNPVDWPQFLEAQLEAFTDAVTRADLTNTFLSLTAGLDTRTVFASLAAQQRLLPAATMSGPHLSIDALTAQRLCRAYGTDHHLIQFGSSFTTELPRYVETASLLSGGLASLDQAPEVYLYHQLGYGYRSRLSGNLGNQVGRGGTEGVSTRGAQLDILGAHFRSAVAQVQGRREHWLLSRLNDSQSARLQFILKNETVLTLCSNYTIGNHYAAQQTPYATRAVIETLALRPQDDAGAPSGSKLRMRLRDLSHRFFGEPETRSFQLKLVKRAGGFAAECPVNWGWRPTGGVSIPAFSRGVATLFGMYARAQGLDSGLFPGSAFLGRLAEFHDFRNARSWLRDSLRAYTLDVLSARQVREAELFDWKTLQPVLDDHFAGRKDHYHTVVYALDLALASRQFTGRTASALPLVHA